jgi:hypothetical protein
MRRREFIAGLGGAASWALCLLAIEGLENEYRYRGRR